MKDCQHLEWQRSFDAVENSNCPICLTERLREAAAALEQKDREIERLTAERKLADIEAVKLDAKLLEELRDTRASVSWLRQDLASAQATAVTAMKERRDATAELQAESARFKKRFRCMMEIECMCGQKHDSLEDFVAHVDDQHPEDPR